MNYKEIAAVMAKQYGLPVEMVNNQIQAESNWNPKAKSSAGAMGMMQIMPATWKEIGAKLGFIAADVWDPAKNIEGGCYYMAWLLGQIRPLVPSLSAEDQYRLALVAYNGGIGYVKKAISKAKAAGNATITGILAALQGTGIRTADVYAYMGRIAGNPLTGSSMAQMGVKAVKAGLVTTAEAAETNKGKTGLWLILGGLAAFWLFKR